MLQSNSTLNLLIDKFWQNFQEGGIANPSLAGIVRESLVVGLIESEFIQAEDFKSSLYRVSPKATLQATPQATPQVTPQVTEQVGEQVREQVNTLCKQYTRRCLLLK